MKESIWGYAIITLGILAIGIIWFFGNVTRTDEHNFNLIKETVEAAMYDALDFAVYREDGTIRIEEEKFVENFIRRFAENADLANNYLIEIFDVNEIPPKVSLRVSSTNKTSLTGELFEFDIVNNIDAIFEAKYQYNKVCELKNDLNSDGLSIGDKYFCKVDGRNSYYFYVLSITSESVNLIMNESIGEEIFMTNRDETLNDNTSNWKFYTRLPKLREIITASGMDFAPGLKIYNISSKSWLYENLNEEYGYWVEETTEEDGWCVYPGGSLKADVDIYVGRPDCKIRPVITISKYSLME